MVELLKQPQYHPMAVVDQVMSIFAGSEGYLDDVPVKEVQRWETEFHTYMREQRTALRDRLAREKKLTDEIVAELRDALTAFKQLHRPASKSSPSLVTAGA
jgi:F-type H+-transporting ATPase subunit alpha